MHCILDLDLAHRTVRKKRSQHDEKDIQLRPHVEELDDGTKFRFTQSVIGS